MTTRLVGQLEDGIRQSGRRDVADEPAEIDRLGPDLLARGVESRQLDQVLDEGPQPADVVDDELAGPARVRPGGRRDGRARIDASATSAATGVRSSWATSATNRRFWVWAASSRRIVSSSVSAIR